MTARFSRTISKPEPKQLGCNLPRLSMRSPPDDVAHLINRRIQDLCNRVRHIDGG